MPVSRPTALASPQVAWDTSDVLLLALMGMAATKTVKAYTGIWSTSRTVQDTMELSYDQSIS